MGQMELEYYPGVKPGNERRATDQWLTRRPGVRQLKLKIIKDINEYKLLSECWKTFWKEYLSKGCSDDRMRGEAGRFWHTTEYGPEAFAIFVWIIHGMYKNMKPSERKP